MDSEFDLLYACNHPGKPAFIVPLSEAFSVSDIMEAETLGLIRRDPARGRNFFSLTPAGKDRLLALYALREERAYSAQQQREQEAKQDAEHRAQRQQAVVDKKKDYRHDFHIACFSVLFALALEHAGDIIDFIQRFLESFIAK